MLEVFGDDAREDIRARTDDDLDRMIRKILRLRHRQTHRKNGERIGKSDNPRHRAQASQTLPPLTPGTLVPFVDAPIMIDDECNDNAVHIDRRRAPLQDNTDSWVAISNSGTAHADKTDDGSNGRASGMGSNAGGNNTQG